MAPWRPAVLRHNRIAAACDRDVAQLVQWWGTASSVLPVGLTPSSMTIAIDLRSGVLLLLTGTLLCFHTCIGTSRVPYGTDNSRKDRLAFRLPSYHVCR